MTRSRANALLLIAGAVWGAAFVAQSTAMDSLGPFAFIALRFALASAVIAPLAYVEAKRADRTLAPRDHGAHALVGLALFLGMAFQQVGLLTTSVTNSGFLTGLYVVFTPLLGIAIFRQWPHRAVWPGVALATLGVYLLGGASFVNLSVGDGLTLVCAMFWALQVVLIGRFVREGNRPIGLALTQFAVTAGLAALVSLAFENTTFEAVLAAGPEILYAGILGSALAFTVQVVAQRHTTAPQAAIFLSSEALFAALFGAMLLGERIGTIGLLGCALMFGAMVLVEIVPMLSRGRALQRDAIAPDESVT